MTEESAKISLRLSTSKKLVLAIIGIVHFRSTPPNVLTVSNPEINAQGGTVPYSRGPASAAHHSLRQIHRVSRLNIMATIGAATKDYKGSFSFVRLRLFCSFELILGNRADRQPRLPPLGDGLGRPQLDTAALEWDKCKEG